MPATLKEREGAKLTARGKASLTPRIEAKAFPAAATLVAAKEVKKKALDVPEGSETPSMPPGNGDQPEKPSEKKPNDNGKGGGKGEGGGGPALPDLDEPGTPNPTSETTRAPGIYYNMTMTEAGNLIEKEADKPKLKPEDIEELQWGPDDMDKGWGREFQKSILKYVEKPFRQKFQPVNAAIIMILGDDGMGDPSADGWEWTTGRKNPKLIHARACQTCAQVCTMVFTDFWAERRDLPDLGK